jgi:uncharacterized protein YbjT (DUF2867 family)
MDKILVAGATGTTGKKIVQLLKSSQHFEPIAMVRKENQKAEFLAQDIKTVLADLEQDVSHTVKNVDKVIFAAGSGGKKVEAVDQEGAKKLIRASEEANIKKFVMLSAMGADEPEEHDELTDYLHAKHNADEFLKSSKLNFTIVRPGRLNNDQGQGKIKLGESLSQQGEITREDVAETLVYSLQDNTANKRTFEILQGDTLIKEAIKTIK